MVPATATERFHTSGRSLCGLAQLYMSKWHVFRVGGVTLYAIHKRVKSAGCEAYAMSPFLGPSQ